MMETGLFRLTGNRKGSGMSTAMNRRFEISVKSALLYVFILLLLGASGAGIWWFKGAPAVFKEEAYKYDPEKRGDLCPLREPNLRNETSVLPGIPHLVTREGHVLPNRRVRKYAYSTNSGMYRGERNFSETKKDGVFRIIVLGTGVSFGNGVDDRFVYSNILEKMLNRKGGPGIDSFEVYNFAVPGSCTDIGFGILKQVVRDFEFNMIVFCYGVNDGLPMFNRSVDWYREVLLLLVDKKRRENLDILFAVEPRSSFYPWNYKAYIDSYHEIIGGDPSNTIIDLPGILDEEEKLHGLRLVREGDEQRIIRYTWGISQTLASFTYPEDPGTQSVSPEVYQYLDTHNISQACYIDGVHINEHGMKLVAQTLFEYIQKQDIVN